MMGASKRTSYTLLSNVMLRELGPSWEESRQNVQEQKRPRLDVAARTPARTRSTSLFSRLFLNRTDRVNHR